ncbi:hypothetical protein OIU34_27795 [Pararhizobium sp. BT-229]|uniref:hypothetical protein n=1 Tax=Pararhizobium sp. BT-229 TaxID=2986923 RepID=UPI0021F6E28B|nr:hypothetical protein [Pararhizobium sp. BT-229]MCV9965681.1 hypothetical protein [Pararhizobium sp. BT-229]
MTATTDFIAELFRAANEVGKLRDFEKQRLIERGVRTVREMRSDAGIRPSRSTRDPLVAIEIANIRSEIHSDESAQAALLDLADMIRNAKDRAGCEGGCLKSDQ